MNFDDRFAESFPEWGCTTCGAHVRPENMGKHHNWHLELEKFIEENKNEKEIDPEIYEPSDVPRSG